MATSIERLALALQATVKKYPGGAQALAKRIRVHAGTFSNKCNPAGEHKMTLDEAISVMRVTEDCWLLDVLAQELGYLVVSNSAIPRLSDSDVLRGWAAWNDEHGDFSKVVSRAYSDKQITATEYEQIRLELFEEFARELHLLRILEEHLIGMKDCRILESMRRQAVNNILGNAIAETAAAANNHLSGLADKLNLRLGNLRRKLNASDTGMNFTLYEIYSLMELTGDHRILYCLANQFGYSCISIPMDVASNDEMELLNVWSCRERERGEVACVIDKVLNSERPSHQDLMKVCEEMFEDFRSGFALLMYIGTLNVTA